MIIQLRGGVEGRSTAVSPENAINLMYERGENGESLISNAGATEFVDLGSGVVRGGIEYNDLAYFVLGSTLYEVDSAGTATSRGSLLTSSGRVSIAHNGVRSGSNQQICIVDGTYGYIYDNTTSTLSQITDADFNASSHVVFIDGYFIFLRTNSDQLDLSALYDGTSIDALDVFSAEGGPDNGVSIIADQRQLFVFGKQSLEVFYNTGDADTPFQRYQGGFKQTGCAAAFSPARVDNNICWLTKNERGHGQVAMMGEAFLPQIISTPELDYQISTYTTIDDAFGYAYQFEGHEFYVLTFPTEQKVWAYDFSTQRWHQRGHNIDGELSRERYNCHIFAHGKHLLGDYSNGKIYQLDGNTFTFDGTRVPRVVTTPNITDEERRIAISAAQLDMEEGQGDPNVSTDTTVWLSYSKDGGHTYTDEVSRDMGDAGNYAKRVIWRRLGIARNWTFKIRTWTPNKVVMKGLYLRPYGGQ